MENHTKERYVCTGVTLPLWAGKLLEMSQKSAAWLTVGIIRNSCNLVVCAYVGGIFLVLECSGEG